MKKLYEFDPKDFGELLGVGNLNAMDAALTHGAAGRIPLNTQNRTILIGLGGAGVKTINRIKRIVQETFQPNWQQYIAFLGIDADWDELDWASCLDRSECILTTQADIDERAANYLMYPRAWRPFANPDQVRRHGRLGYAGSGRRRFVGKLKLHDWRPGRMSVDEEIAYKISWLRGNTFAPLSPVGTGNYEVYVIGGIAGGTGGGGFLEMPALISKGLQTNAVRIHAMLYLPDTMTGLDPVNAGELEASGYASLKELNYYQGVCMRKGYAEQFSCNDPAWPELKIRSDHDFFSMPYLVGTKFGPQCNGLQVAMETVTEFIVGILASSTAMGMPVSMVDSVLSTALVHSGYKNTVPGEAGMEIPGEAHEFPKRFGAVGVARAAVPRKAVKAYIVGKACDAAGLLPVDATARAALKAQGAGLIPFRGADDLLNATEGTAKAKDILEPLEKMLATIHNGKFNFCEDLSKTKITWTEIKKGYYDYPAIPLKADLIIKNRTTPAMMNDLRKVIRTAYDEYRKKVQKYVREEGPYAFVNLYTGKFAPVNGEFGMGIERMIKNLINGDMLDGKRFAAWKPVETAWQDLETARKNITNASSGPFGIETSANRTQAAQWVEAYNAWGKARINEVRREVALGANGTLTESFLTPAAKLTQEVGAFGRILEGLTGIYTNHGSKLETYDDFATAQDSKTEVNLSAISEDSYKWVKAQADAALAAVNAQKLRDDLVEDFFAFGEDGMPNSHKWLNVPATCVKSVQGTDDVQLTVRDVAIPARAIFDQYLQTNFPTTLNVSVEAMFTQLAATGKNFKNTAEKIVDQLLARSEPQFRGDIPQDCKFGFIMYPNALKNGTNNGPAIAEAIEEAASDRCHGVQIYASDDADSIVFYQLAAPMEIYRLADLSSWERYYESGRYGLNNHLAFLHGMSPDTTVIRNPGKADRYTENIPWKDYPSISRPTGDSRIPDAQSGLVSREGQLRLELDKMIDRAKELGVLYSERVNGADDQWIVKRVACNKATQWKFDIMGCNPDPATGLLPLGKALAETVAGQNYKDIDHMTKTVGLEFGGVMNKPAPTEKLAWEFAARVLFVHVPMRIEIRETMKLFEAWAKDIEIFNDKLKAQFLPAQMVWMIKGRVLRKNPDGTWVLVKADGRTQNVAVLSEVMKKFMPPKDKKLVENGLLGYYLFGKLSTVLTDNKAFDEACNRAKAAIERMAADRDIDLLTQGEEQAAIILAEREALAEKGAHLDGDTERESKSSFVNAMAGIADQAILRDIDLFYYRLGMWEVL